MRPAPEPLAVNALTTLGIGTVAWFVAFCVLLVLLLLRGRDAEAAHSQWLWTSLAGWLLGLLGMYLTHRHYRRQSR